MTELKIVNAGPDTFLVNFKFANEAGMPNGDSFPEHVATQLDTWQKAARKEHAAVPTDLLYRGQTLFIRPHGSGVWSWLLYTDEVKLSMSYGTLNGGVFCQARFASHLLWSVGPEAAIVDLEAMLYDLLGQMLHEQASEIHLCTDVQGWDVSTIDWQHGFVSRVVRIRERPDVPTEAEQEGGLSPLEIHQLETAIQEQKQEGLHQPMVETNHRRIATLDFGSHGSDLSAQIYNKSAEIKKHRKDWFEPIWRANGWDGESTVWRVEFRFKRKCLASFDLNDAFHVLSCLEVLWRYATEKWLRYVDVTASQDSNKSRLPTHPAWQVVQAAYTREQAAEDEGETRDAEGEFQMRLASLVQEQPLTVIEQAVTLSTQDEMAGRAMREVLQEESLEVVEETAHDILSLLSAEQVRAIVERLSPVSFQEVQATLIKRARHMAKRKACIAGGIGYIRSAVALAGDELARQPDLMASLVWFFGEMQCYDKKRGRVHLEEVWKKRLAYGFVTAQQVEEEQALHGIDLYDADWAALTEQLDRLLRKPKRVFINQQQDSDAA